MKKMDRFDFDAEELLDQLLGLEHEDRQKAVSLLAGELRTEMREGYEAGVRTRVYVTTPPLKREIWVVQRKPLKKPDDKYRSLEGRSSKKDAIETAASYNSFIADCEYRAWKYVPVEE